MAGEVQDLSLQADCLPTGSISFGRFAFESLSWQRRSSFGYNRHLEDVERYATPGLVTQKKTYFEEQFKKRALLRQVSSEHQNGINSRTKGDDTEDHMDYMEERHNTERQQHLALPDETSDIMDSYEYDTTKRNKEVFQYPSHDENSALSDEHQYNVTECDQKLKSMIDKKVVDSSGILVDRNEAIQTQSRCDVLQSNMNSMHIGIELKSEKEARTMDRLLGKRDPSCKSPIYKKDNAPSLKKMQRASPKVKTAVEQKPAKPNARTQPPVPKINRNLSNGQILSSGKASSRTSRKVEKGNTIARKSDKLSPSTVPASTFSNSKNMKSGDLRRQTTQVKQEIGSENGQRGSKGGFNASLTTERPRKAVSLVKVDGKPIGATTNLRSDERTGKRTEMRASSRTQDKMEVVNSQAKPARLQRKCTSPVSRTTHCGISPAFTMRANRTGLSTQPTSFNHVERSTSSEGQTACSVVFNQQSITGLQDNNRILQSSKRSETGKELRGKSITQQR